MIREATIEDLPGMIALAAAKREEYEAYAPTFWRRAIDAEEKQSSFFEATLSRENTLCLVCDHNGELDGFLIASIVSAPPVYDPGSLVCMVDDFTVADSSKWDTVGKQLLEEVRRTARSCGAELTVVVCGHRDEAKRKILKAVGLYVASEWYVAP